jgi:hypothetical protein
MSKRVFLSYKRDSEPDEPLALEVHRALTKAGHGVFIDQQMPAGIKWAEQISSQIRDCDALVVFLTAISSRSEMVQSEIEMARRYERPIVPVRVAFAGRLPHPLNAYLDPIQYAEWRGPSDTQTLIANLGRALNDLPLPAVLPSHEEPEPHQLPPAPGGAIDLDDPHYVTRPFDAKALRLAASAGQTVVLKGPRQVGKTSLLFRMIDSAQKAGKSVAFVDFQLFETAALGKPALFYERLTASIAQELGIDAPQKPETPQDVTRWMEALILKRLPQAIVLAIDESERAMWTEFREDLFGMLRAWHNLRASPTRRDWKKLDLFLVTSTEPALFIQGAQSPFNVGTVLPITPFGTEEMNAANEEHGEPLSPEELERLRILVGGQPYLVSKALYEISPPTLNMTPSELFAQAADDRGPYREHLKRFLLALLEMPDVTSAFREILQGRGSKDEKLVCRLEAAGLATRADGKAISGCPLYQEFFARRLVM